MKGIILAGGSGTRLYPLTIGVSKQLMPIYNKPMIYYPLSTLMLAGIKDILIITTKHDKDSFVKLLGNGDQFGINITYQTQNQPNGLAESFIIGEKFIGNDKVCLILGDNLFYGAQLGRSLSKHIGVEGAKIFAHQVSDPSQFGVVEFDQDMKVISLAEKEKQPKSNYAVPGLYFYDNQVVEIAKNIKPSARGELEITDVNKQYLAKGQLSVEILERNVVWFDTGKFEDLNNSSNFIKIIESQQGILVNSPHEIALRKGFITEAEFKKTTELFIKSEYGKKLEHISKSIDIIKH